MNLKQLVAALIFFAWFAGCSDLISTPNSGGELFLPPPAAPQTPLVVPLSIPTASSIGLDTIIQNTQTPDCLDNLIFIEDLTIPDGTVIPAGKQIDKRWKVQNAGTCNWNEYYRLKLIAGPGMNASQEHALYPARVNTQTEIRILFTAPESSGTYRSAWQALNPKGELFGDMIFVEIVVQ
jgi:hypothetical protein